MVGLKSDVGMIRKLNEDYENYFESENYSVYIVADGMGGHNAGEVASKMATEAVIDFFRINYTNDGKNCILKEAVEFANRKVFKISNSLSEFSGMGTTTVAGLVLDDKVQIANVGDSSCYGFDGDALVKITKDHSLVQELVDIGSITEQEALNHPKKNVITRAIGTTEEVKVDIFEVELNRFELFLLCTDGLTNEVQEDKILNILKEEKDLNTACEKLVESAKDNGGRDNVTVMLFGGEV